MYVTITMTDLNEIKDLEILEEIPQFPDRGVESEDAPFGLRVRVFDGNVNGGDSVELHWNDQVGEWQ